MSGKTYIQFIFHHHHRELKIVPAYMFFEHRSPIKSHLCFWLNCTIGLNVYVFILRITNVVFLSILTRRYVSKQYFICLRKCFTFIHKQNYSNLLNLFLLLKFFVYCWISLFIDEILVRLRHNQGGEEAGVFCMSKRFD